MKKQQLIEIIKRVVREETMVRDLGTVAQEWVRLVQSPNGRTNEKKLNELGKILFDAGILDLNQDYKPGTGDTKYHWIGDKKLRGSVKRVAQYIQRNIE